MKLSMMTEVVIGIIFLTGVVYAIGSGEIITSEITSDIGSNATLPCDQEREIRKTWIRSGKERTGDTTILENGDLFLSSLTKNDTGIYECTIEDDEENVQARVHLTVKTPPGAFQDVSIVPSSVLALLQWSSVDDGGYPITNITVRYRNANAKTIKWHYVDNAYITLNAAQVDVYKLNPNTTYLFEIWASNKLGTGEVTSVVTHTLHDNQEIELARHLLEGAETFDTRTWLAAVLVVMVTLIILTIGTCCVLYHDWQIPTCEESEKDPEKIELIPHIVSNPNFYEEPIKVKKLATPTDTSKITNPVRV